MLEKKRCNFYQIRTCHDQLQDPLIIQIRQSLIPLDEIGYIQITRYHSTQLKTKVSEMVFLSRDLLIIFDKKKNNDTQTFHYFKYPINTSHFSLFLSSYHIKNPMILIFFLLSLQVSHRSLGCPLIFFLKCIFFQCGHIFLLNIIRS